MTPKTSLMRTQLTNHRRMTPRTAAYSISTNWTAKSSKNNNSSIKNYKLRRTRPMLVRSPPLAQFSKPPVGMMKLVAVWQEQSPAIMEAFRRAKS